MAFAGVAGPVCCDAADGLMWRDLPRKLRQHGRVNDIAGGDLDGANFQRFLVEPNVDFAPNPAVWAAMPEVTLQRVFGHNLFEGQRSAVIAHVDKRRAGHPNTFFAASRIWLRPARGPVRLWSDFFQSGQDSPFPRFPVCDTVDLERCPSGLGSGLIANR